MGQILAMFVVPFEAYMKTPNAPGRNFAKPCLIPKAADPGEYNSLLRQRKMKSKTAAELTSINAAIKALERVDDNAQLWQECGLPASFKPAGVAINIHVPRSVQFIAAYRQEDMADESYKQMAANLTEDHRLRLSNAELLAQAQAKCALKMVKPVKPTAHPR